MFLSLIILYILLSEAILIILMFASGRKDRIPKIILYAPLAFPFLLISFIFDLMSPIEGIYRANSSSFFAYKSKWDNENPDKEFPVMDGLLFTLKTRYPLWSGKEIIDFIEENKINNLISLVEAIIKKERPDLNNSWIRYKSKFN